MSSPRTFAAKSYDFVGTVTMIRGATVTVSNGKKTLEFNYSEFSELPEVPEVGDEVSVRYFLEATQTELRRRPAQQPRQLPGQRPEPFRKRGIPGEKKHILLDDRAFYDA